MRILLINYEYPPVGAGAATATQEIARALTGLGHKVSVLTTRYKDLVGAADEQGVRVIRLRSRRGRRESALISEMASYVFHSVWTVRRVVRRDQIQGILAFFSIPGGPAAWWAHQKAGVPYVISLRGGDVPGSEQNLRLVHFLFSPLRRCILRAARAVVANSSGLKQLSEKIDSFPVAVIPNGVDTEFYTPGPRPTTPPRRLLFVGRFQAQKNLQWMIQQIGELRKRCLHPFAVDLVGDGPHLAMLQSTVRALQLDSCVNFHGWEGKEALRAHYRAAGLVVNPSLYEGMPNVVLEAMSCGRAVLASKVPGNDSLVVDGNTGWLFPLGDGESFRARIAAFLDNPDIVVALGDAARERAEKEYSWKETARSYLNLLDSPTPGFLS